MSTRCSHRLAVAAAPAFLSAEMRTYLTPNPGAPAFFGGIGVAP